jgi:amino acid transporter
VADRGTGLVRVLGVRELVFLNVSAIVGFRWLSTAAQIGPSSLTLWIVAAALFFVPSGLIVAELSARIPGDGGPYLWTREAFGDVHAFVAGWCYLVTNLVFLPSLLLYTAQAFFLLGGDAWRGLGDNALLSGGFCLICLWIATLLNVVGLQRGTWLTNVGAQGTWIIFALLGIGAAVALMRNGSATPFGATDLIPNLAAPATMANLATIALAYAGLEVGTLMGGEIRDPARAVPRAVLISAVLITLLYLLGTSALLVAIPPGEVDAITGVPQAMAEIGRSAGLAQVGWLTALVLVVSNLGGVGAWVAANARLPFAMGLNAQLPPVLGSIHPRWRTPHVSLLVQAGIATVLTALSMTGSSVRQAIYVLTDMTIVLYFIPLLYMFAALPVIRARAGLVGRGTFRVPGGLAFVTLVAASAILITLGAIVLSVIPPDDGSSAVLFLLKVVGGSLLLIALGFGFLVASRHRVREVPATRDPDPATGG